MASGSISKSISSYSYKLIVDWTSTPTISSNSSTVKATIKFYAPYELYIGARTGNTITINGKDYSYDSPKISTDDGGTYTLATVTSDAIKHNADGSKSITITCKFKLNATIGGTSYSTVTATGTAKLDNIARAATITAAPNFNDEGNPTITYSNPAGSTVTTLQACIADTSSNVIVTYRDISKTGTSYTFSLTSAERTALRQACSTANSMGIRFYVKTELGGETYKNYLAKTLSIINANPTINPTAVDKGSVSITLTGDAENKVIKGYNNMAVAINATANKNATLKSYKISCGGKSITTASGTLGYVESGTFTFTATDSRGNSTTKTLTKTLINYVPITCSLSAKNPTPDGAMSFTIKGNYFNGSFGAVNNTLTVQYRYKVEGGSYGSWTTVTATKSGNTYTVTTTLTGLDYRQAYVVQARATDEIETVNTSEKSVKSIPVFDWGADDFNFNVDVKAQENLIFKNGGVGVRGTTTDGAEIQAFQPCNGNNNCVIGYGGHESAIGATNLYGNDVNILTNTDLTVNDGDTVYSILGALKAMTASYNLPVTVTAGANYSEVGASAYLVGNCLRMYMKATRNSNASVGDITNEEVMTIKVNHGGKIKSSFTMGFTSASTGAVATFYHDAGTKNDDNNMTFVIRLCATATAENYWNAYWAIPVTIDFSKFV